MKKSIIALMGLFTLVACSEDSYQEADKINETTGTGAVDNTGSQNSIKTVSTGTGLNSPYDIDEYGNAKTYYVRNLTPYTLKLTPYIGLAYFDGTDDGVYNNKKLATPINLKAPGSYLNLYAGGKSILI